MIVYDYEVEVIEKENVPKKDNCMEVAPVLLTILGGAVIFLTACLILKE